MKKVTVSKKANSVMLRWSCFDRSYLLGLFWVALWLLVSVFVVGAMREVENASPLLILFLFWGLLGATFLPLTLKGLLNRITVTLTIPESDAPFRDAQPLVTLRVQEGPLSWKPPLVLHLKRGDVLFACDEADSPNEWTTHRIKVRFASQEEVVLLRELPTQDFAVYLARLIEENLQRNDA
jgi:hypothetical protein